MRKLYTVFEVKRVPNKKIKYIGETPNKINYVVYKIEYGKVLPTYYSTKKEAEKNKNWIAG